MKYFDAVFQYGPTGAWKLDGNYDDFSGLGNNGSLVSGTPSTLLPTSYGSVNSLSTGGGTVIRVPSDAYTQLKGPRPFSLVVNFFPVALSTETSVISHDSNLDGITIDSINVHWTVKSSTTTYRISSPVVAGSMQIVGVFNGSSISMYVNGQLAGSMEAPIVSFPAFSSPGFLYSGQGASTFGLDNIVSYNRAISRNEIENLYTSMIDNQGESAAYAAYGSIFVDMSDPIKTPHVVREWSSFDDALYSGVNVSAGGVEVETPGGSWTTSLMLADLSTVMLSSATIEWSGSNITVETSMDNSTWVTATNGNLIPSMTFPYNATSKCLFIRVTFAALGVLTSLKVSTYTGFGFFASDNNRAVTTLGSVSDSDSNFVPGQTDSIGARFFPGSMRIAADSSAAPISIRGAEFMFKIPAGSPSFTVFSNGAGTVMVSFSNTGTITVTGATSAVLNGVSIAIGSAVPVVREAWMHLGLAFTAANTDCYFGTNSTNTQTSTFRLSRPVLYTETVNTAALQENFVNLFSRASTALSVGTLGISQVPVHITYNNAWSQV